MDDELSVSSDSDSSDNSMSSGSDVEVEPSVARISDETASRNTRWLLSMGKNGCLHLADPEDRALTICGRCLKRPEEGIGLQQALQTGHVWSPRCRSKFSGQQATWWEDAHRL